MATTFQPRPEAELIPADLKDRRRLAESELFMLVEEGGLSQLDIGQVILKHIRSETEVMIISDAIQANAQRRRHR